MKSLTRQGILVEEQGEIYLASDDGDSHEARAIPRLQAAAYVYRIAYGPRAGQKVLTLQGAKPSAIDIKQRLCANSEGFSLHAGQVVLKLKTRGLTSEPIARAAPQRRHCRAFDPGPSLGRPAGQPVHEAVRARRRATKALTIVA